MAEKLWLAAKLQGHRNPFGRHLAEYSVLELDWVLEMSARDDPKQLSFSRSGQSAPLSQPEIFAAWASVLTGPALTRFMAGKWSEPAAAAGERLRRGTGAFVPRMTRGGVPV